MIFVISIIVWLLNRLWALALLVVSLIYFYFLLSKPSKKSRTIQKNRRPSTGILTLALPVLVVVFILFRSNLVSSLIYHFGEETVGRVISVDSIPEMYNEQQVYRHQVIYHDLEENLLESSFKTSDFNVYPSANRVRYPGTGENFTLRYMEYAPSEFVILTNLSEERVRELYQDRNALREKLEFDPDQLEFEKELEEIEFEIQELEMEHLKDQVQDSKDVVLSYEYLVTEVDRVEGIHYSPQLNKVVTVINYKNQDGDMEDAVLSISLTNPSIDYFYPLNSFEEFIGLLDDNIIINNWSKDQLLSISLDNFDYVDLNLPLNEMASDYIMIGDYFIDYNYSQVQSKAYHLTDSVTAELDNEVIHHVLANEDWTVFTNRQQSNILETLLTLESLSDYRQYFSNTLANENLSSEHSHADSGLFFSEDEVEIDTMNILKMGDILLRSGLKNEFNQLISNLDKNRIIGIEEDNTIYGIGLEDGQLLLLKKDSTGQFSQKEIKLNFEDFDINSLHLEDSFLILTKEGLFELTKDDSLIREIIKL